MSAAPRARHGRLRRPRPRQFADAGAGTPHSAHFGGLSCPCESLVRCGMDGALAMAEIENSAQQFKGAFLSTGATISWTAEQEGFQFQSDNLPDPKANLISVLGREKNGVLFS